MQWTRNSPRARLAAAATPSVAPRKLTPSQRYGLLRKGSSYLRLTGRSLVRLPEQRAEASKSAAAEPAQGAPSRHAAVGGAAPLRKHLTLLVRGGSAYELARGGRALQRVGASKGAVRVAAPSSAGANRGEGSGEGSGEGGKSGGAPRPAAAAASSSSSTSGGGPSSRLAPGRLARAAGPPRPQPRRVQLGWQEFVRSGDGRSLQRSTSARQRQAASTLMAAASGRLRQSTDFKRQRERRAKAEARQLAAAGVQCSYFSKYGRCCRTGGECLYDHDPEKIAICLGYLHGQCADEACPLSHDPTPQRMPVCRLFLLGLCVAPSCRYTHVHLGTATPLCDAFARCGWCAAGDACERRHERFCESYSERGECSLGEQCRLSRHRRTDAPASLFSATPAERAMRQRAAAAAAVDSPSCFPQLGTPLGSSSAVSSPLKPP